jgi:hypothetical protein
MYKVQYFFVSSSLWCILVGQDLPASMICDKKVNVSTSAVLHLWLERDIDLIVGIHTFSFDPSFNHCVEAYYLTQLLICWN